MDDTTAFIELSALLTGHYNLVTDRPEKIKTFIEPVAKEYQRRLAALFSGAAPPQLTPLLNAYKTLALATPKPAIDDALLAKFRATQEFKDNEAAAKQIVNIWYISQFKPEDKPDAPTLDGGFYEEGLVWSDVKAHPIGFSHQPHGYWTKQP